MAARIPKAAIKPWGTCFGYKVSQTLSCIDLKLYNSNDNFIGARRAFYLYRHTLLRSFFVMDSKKLLIKREYYIHV